MKTITLEDGKKVKVGSKQFENLQLAIRKENPKEIAKCMLDVTISSPEMMEEFALFVRELPHNLRHQGFLK